MNRKERLHTAYNYLKSKGLVHKQRDIAERMQATTANVSKAFSGAESFLTDNFLRRFNNAYGNIFSNDWLVFGEGTMLPASSTIQNIVSGENSHNSNTSNKVDEALLAELAEQRKLTQVAQEQVNQLIAIIQKMQG